MNIKTIPSAGYNFWSYGILDNTMTYIWNGTGPKDYGGDWRRLFYGVESPLAKHTGTNGLDAFGMKKGSKIVFGSQKIVDVDVSWHDLLLLWVNVFNWETDKELTIKFDNSITLDLGEYIDLEFTGEWQRAIIPLDDFILNSAYVNELTLRSTGDIDIYIDDITFGIGKTFHTYTAVPVCRPEVLSHEVGEKSVQGYELKPSMKVTSRFPGPINL